MRKIKAKYDDEGVLPKGVFNFASSSSKKLSLRIDVKEFKINFGKVDEKKQNKA